MPSKAFSPNLTSYDLLKSLALLLMVLDHIGYFFYPENDWYRAVGRASMPIWFFLIGFARTRDFSKPIWIGAGLIILSTFVFGASVLPLNILVTILIVRAVLDVVARTTFRNWEIAMYGSFALAVLMLPTVVLFQYGTSALLIAMAGYMVRNAGNINISERGQTIFKAFTVVFYAFTQILVFQFDKAVAQTMVIGIGLVSILLYYFRPVEVPEVEQKLPKFVVSALQFGGRYTLEIYVFHVILFEFIACLNGLQRYGWFQWDLIR